jgi:hypothetical protein
MLKVTSHSLYLSKSVGLHHAYVGKQQRTSDADAIVCG